MSRLFPQINGILHGGDYNPDQWLDRPDILKEDIRLMKKAGMNSVTLGVFAWSAYEPREGEYHFEWLLGIMDELYKNGIYTILATPTGARPAWLDERYPEAMRVGKNGVRNRHGLRHNHCMTAPAFRQKAEQLIRRLAEAVKDHPGLILWHISNELGGECFCPHCQKAFQNYLKIQFDNDIDKLNKAWWTSFWSHTYNSFEQVEPPFANGEVGIMGQNLAWREFTSWSMTEYVKFERDILKEITPGVPVTTNFMNVYPTLDYHQMAKELDMVSWDSYPMYHNDFESFEQTGLTTSFAHAVIRGTKPGQPFLLMESTPSLVNWHPFNKLKRPGVHRLSNMQAISVGSDTVQYFQWRKGRGSSEQYHGAVIDHLGRDDTRVFCEVAALGEDLKKLHRVAGSVNRAAAAVLFDWSTRWAISDMQGLSKEKKQYELTCQKQYETLTGMGIETDVVSPEADLSGYRLVVAPMLYLLKPGRAARLREFVLGGGQLVLTYLSGYVNETTLCYLGGFPGDGLKELAGLYSEEIDTLYPSDKNSAEFGDGTSFEIRDYCEILKVQDAEVLASYGSDFYAGTPVVTKKKNGAGAVWYVGARLEQAGMEHIYTACLEAAGENVKKLPDGIEFHRRYGEDVSFGFYMNHSETENTVSLEKAGTDLLTGRRLCGEVTLEPYGVVVIEEE